MRLIASVMGRNSEHIEKKEKRWGRPHVLVSDQALLFLNRMTRMTSTRIIAIAMIR